MKQIAKLLVLMSLSSPCFAEQQAVDAAKPTASSVAPKEYLVGPGDLLDISVWKEEGLTKDTLVRPDGGISFPLVGDLQVQGLTVDTIAEEITKRLTNYFSDPVVSVSLKQVNQKFYVLGKVTRPGEIVSANRVDVMQALSMAGGLTQFADEDDITVIHKEGNKTISLDFDYSEVSQGKKLEQNILLQRGDVVIVH